MRITPEGDALAESACAASQVADRILSTLTPEEIESLNVLTEKIIHQCKDMGARGERQTWSPLSSWQGPRLPQVAFGMSPMPFQIMASQGPLFFLKRLFLT